MEQGTEMFGHFWRIVRDKNPDLDCSRFSPAPAAGFRFKSDVEDLQRFELNQTLMPLLKNVGFL